MSKVFGQGISRRLHMLVYDNLVLKFNKLLNFQPKIKPAYPTTNLFLNSGVVYIFARSFQRRSLNRYALVLKFP